MVWCFFLVISLINHTKSVQIPRRKKWINVGLFPRCSISSSGCDLAFPIWIYLKNYPNRRKTKTITKTGVIPCRELSDTYTMLSSFGLLLSFLSYRRLTAEVTPTCDNFPFLIFLELCHWPYMIKEYKD